MWKTPIRQYIANTETDKPRTVHEQLHKVITYIQNRIHAGTLEGDVVPVS